MADFSFNKSDTGIVGMSRSLWLLARNSLVFSRLLLAFGTKAAGVRVSPVELGLFDHQAYL
jgi:hypothetical protein